MIYLMVLIILGISILIFNWQKIKLKLAKSNLKDRVMLEISPNATTKDFKNMYLFFNNLHNLSQTNQFGFKFLKKRNLYSLEIYANKSSGIHFLIIVPKSLKQAVVRLIASYDWTLQVKEVPPYNFLKNTPLKLMQFKLDTNNLTTDPNDLRNQDPLTLILSNMVQLKEEDNLAFQIVYIPKMSKQNQTSFWSKIFQIPLNLISNLQTFESTKTNHAEYKTKIYKKPMFKTNIRFLIQAQTNKHIKEYSQSLESALNVLNLSKFNTKTNFYTLSYFKLRLLEPFKSGSFLDSDKLSELFHLPNMDSISFENLNTVLSKSLPSYPNVDKFKKEGVILGDNLHQQNKIPITLSSLERSRHTYIVGGTGSGKTTLLKYQIVQDIKAGKGVAVVDPHGDLAEDLLGFIPKSRLKDVIYFNPADYKYPIGINLLETPKALDELEEARAKDLVAETIVSIFRKVFNAEKEAGHRIEYVLRNTIHTAFYVKNANFFTIFKILNDISFNKQIVYKHLKDENLKNFWLSEIYQAGSFQRVKMQAGVTSKMGRFLFSQAAKNVFEKTDNCLNFKEIINDNKIFICNFSKGLLGEDTSQLFGATILAKIQLAILEQVQLKQKVRVPFYLYVDEFQNFASRSFIEMLSEARKYKLHLILAEQSTQQQQDRQLIEIILANVGTIIAFKSGSPKDAEILLPLFKPYISVSEFVNLPAYNFYAKLSAITPKEPISGITKLISIDPNKHSQRQQEVVEISRRQFYGIKKAKVTAKH